MIKSNCYLLRMVSTEQVQEYSNKPMANPQKSTPTQNETGCTNETGSRFYTSGPESSFCVGVE